MYLYLTIRSNSEKELVRAECHSITGVYPDENGIAIRDNPSDSELCTDISRAAYIKTCLNVITHTNDISELYSQLDRLNLDSDRFRVSVHKISRSISIDSQRVMHEIGARIGGNPDLSNPQATFIVIVTYNDIWFGEILSESTRTWDEHIHKAQQYSSALPARFARAMINLVAVPGDAIIDPCCGSGTILIEAVSIGIKAFGYDNNPLMVQASTDNLRHFNMNSMVALADARSIKGRFDAVVTDLPYGKNCLIDDQSCFEILSNLPNLAPKAAIVAGLDLSQLLLQVGYRKAHVIHVPKGSLVRYVHVVEL
jgi:tRNA G10  N-methylase Trm11